MRIVPVDFKRLFTLLQASAFEDSRQTSLPANWDPALQRRIQATVQDDCTPGEMDGLLQSAYPLTILRSAVSEAFICPQSKHY